jgi:hypothetical protein
LTNRHKTDIINLAKQLIMEDSVQLSDKTISDKTIIENQKISKQFCDTSSEFFQQDIEAKINEIVNENISAKLYRKNVEKCVHALHTLKRNNQDIEKIIIDAMKSRPYITQRQISAEEAVAKMWIKDILNDIWRDKATGEALEISQPEPHLDSSLGIDMAIIDNKIKKKVQKKVQKKVHFAEDDSEKNSSSNDEKTGPKIKIPQITNIIKNLHSNDELGEIDHNHSIYDDVKMELNGEVLKS